MYITPRVLPAQVVCHGESLRPPSALPITAIRPPGKDRVGYAAQSFNIPEIPGVMSGWISGFVELPAGAIKVRRRPSATSQSAVSSHQSAVSSQQSAVTSHQPISYS